MLIKFIALTMLFFSDWQPSETETVIFWSKVCGGNLHSLIVMRLQNLTSDTRRAAAAAS